MNRERGAVIWTIGVYRETILDVCREDAQMALRVAERDPGVLGALLELACARTGLSTAFYEEAVGDDQELYDLQRLTVMEIVADPADPGPA